ncbi:uncharacterized protein [Ptychodera flava]|uniref:uncharacterized protein n=1 Tax=Ptychodera flava TaxID=63121 RepID=UPI00396A4EA9
MDWSFLRGDRCLRMFICIEKEQGNDYNIDGFIDNQRLYICLTLMVVNAVAIAEDQEDYDCVYNEITQRYDCYYLTRHDCMAAEGIMISVSVVSALLAIINSVLCCIGCCCRCCRKTVTPQVVYVPGQEGAIPATNVMYAVQGNQPSGAVYLIPSTTQNMYPYNCTVSHQLPTVQSPPAYPMQSGYTVTQTIPTVKSFPGPAPQRQPEQPQPDQVLDQNATNVSNDTKLPL